MAQSSLYIAYIIILEETLDRYIDIGYRQTDGRMDGQTDRQIDRQADRQTDRQTDR